MTVKAFRNFIKNLREPTPYCFGYTECKGGLNILSGAANLIAGIGMKWSSDENYRQTHSPKHIKNGLKALKHGLYEFLPGMIVILGTGLALKSIAPLSLRNTRRL